jgi:hypothetical protein
MWGRKLWGVLAVLSQQFRQLKTRRRTLVAKIQI